MVDVKKSEGEITLQRRHFFKKMAAATAAVALPLQLVANNAQAATAVPVNLPPTPNLPDSALAVDSSYWSAVRSLYSVTPDIINLENGYWGIMAEPVRIDFIANTNRINRENSFYARQYWARDYEAVRQEVAKAIGADTGEIAFTRNATEAMQMLVSNYNKLKPGDTVVFSDLDYDSVKFNMNWLQERRNVNAVKFNIPEPATRANVLAAYEKVLSDNPKTRMLLLTYVGHLTGLVMPVAEIAAMAKKRGVDVILDAAHAWGQVDFKISDLGVDYAAFNLHKWIGAPQGAGFFYIAKNRLADIDRAYGDEDFPKDDIRSRIRTGTVNFATFLTVPSALKLHAQIGQKAKALRLRYLRDYWVSRAREFKGLDILTPDEPGMVAAMTSFRLTGKGTKEDNDKIVAQLRDEFGVFTARRAGVAKGQCIRVTVAPYTSLSDLDRLVAGLKKITASV